MSLEELKSKLGDQLLEFIDTCDHVMTLEGHIGALDSSILLLISLMHVAEGRTISLTDIDKKDLVYPLPKLAEIEVKLDSEPVIEILE